MQAYLGWNKNINVSGGNIIWVTQFITAVNSFHPARKYTWEISDTSLALLDIKISIEGNGLCTSVYYKLTDSQLLVVFIFTSITRQELHTFFTVSQTSSFMW